MEMPFVFFAWTEVEISNPHGVVVHEDGPLAHFLRLLFRGVVGNFDDVAHRSVLLPLARFSAEQLVLQRPLTLKFHAQYAAFLFCLFKLCMAMRSDLTLMATFVRVVSSGGLSKAARQLGASQPTVTRQIRALEDRLGVQLLARSTHGIALTEMGRHYFDFARAQID